MQGELAQFGFALFKIGNIHQRADARDRRAAFVEHGAQAFAHAAHASTLAENAMIAGIAELVFVLGERAHDLFAVGRMIEAA